MRADRFPQHQDYDDESDDDIMINSFSSCSPRYSKVYQKVQEMKVCHRVMCSIGASSMSSIEALLKQLLCDINNQCSSIIILT